MKYYIQFLLLLGFIFLVACESESHESKDDKITNNDLREGDIMDKKECFELKYPVSIIFPNEEITSVKNEDDLIDQLKKWYKENPKAKDKPGLQYPVKVVFKGEVIKTISDEDQMIKLKKYCDKKDSGDDKKCFDLSYPISYEMPDGSIVSGDNEEAVDGALKKWYENNSGSKEKPSLVYPVDVIFDNGDSKTINNEDEMIAMKKDC